MFFCPIQANAREMFNALPAGRLTHEPDVLCSPQSMLSNRHVISHAGDRPTVIIIFTFPKLTIRQSEFICYQKTNARDWSRTSTSRRTLAPQASASAYSATRATPLIIHYPPHIVNHQTPIPQLKPTHKTSRNNQPPKNANVF